MTPEEREERRKKRRERIRGFFEAIAKAFAQGATKELLTFIGLPTILIAIAVFLFKFFMG